MLKLSMLFGFSPSPLHLPRLPLASHHVISVAKPSSLSTSCYVYVMGIFTVYYRYVLFQLFDITQELMGKLL